MISTDYATRIPCNDTLYQLWEKTPGSSENPCLNYDFPQDPTTELDSTSTTPSSTPSPSSSGNADSTSDDDPRGGSSASSDSNSQDSERDADEDAGNGADPVLSVPVGGGLVMAGLILGSLL